MRVTFALYVEINSAKLHPDFFREISQLEFMDSLDPSAIRERFEFGRVELECGSTNRDLARCEQFATRLAAHRIGVAERLLNLPEGWLEYGRVYAERVSDTPNPSWSHGMEGDNPAVICPKCSKPMRRRDGRNGKPFYGCSQYPSCRGSRPISE